MSTAGVVAALAAEARTVGPATRRADGLLQVNDGLLVAVSGMGGTSAAGAARRLIDAGATALISWGMAGGLDPALPAGAICLPETVLFEHEEFATDHHWRELVAAAIAPRRVVVGGSLVTRAAPIEDVAGKAMAFRETGAAAVDMESSSIAEAAMDGGLPFIAVRVVVDTALDSLPAAVLAASSNGQVSMAPLIRGLARSPMDIAPLIRLAQRYRTAMRSLRAVARTGALAPIAFATTSKTRIA